MLSPQYMADRLLCQAHDASFAYLSLSLISLYVNIDPDPFDTGSEPEIH